MNVHCPTCQTVFRVDPARVPAGGVKARCVRCSAVFRLDPPAVAAEPDAGAAAAAATPPGAGEADPGAARGPGPEAASSTASAREEGPPSPEEASAPSAEQPTTAPGDEVSAAPAAPAGAAATAPSAPQAPAADPSRPAPPTAGGAPADAGTPQRPVFGSRDPDARAKRIARALVSDIVAYHPERREQALAAGNLRASFRDEIMKSWEEYVAQVGIETAKGTPHFRDALNAILAEGQKLF